MGGIAGKKDQLCSSLFQAQKGALQFGKGILPAMEQVSRAIGDGGIAVDQYMQMILIPKCLGI